MTYKVQFDDYGVEIPLRLHPVKALLALIALLVLGAGFLLIYAIGITGIACWVILYWLGRGLFWPVQALLRRWKGRA